MVSADAGAAHSCVVWLRFDTAALRFDTVALPFDVFSLRFDMVALPFEVFLIAVQPGFATAQSRPPGRMLPREAL